MQKNKNILEQKSSYASAKSVASVSANFSSSNSSFFRSSREQNSSGSFSSRRKFFFSRGKSKEKDVEETSKNKNLDSSDTQQIEEEETQQVHAHSFVSSLSSVFSSANRFFSSTMSSNTKAPYEAPYGCIEGGNEEDQEQSDVDQHSSSDQYSCKSLKIDSSSHEISNEMEANRRNSGEKLSLIEDQKYNSFCKNYISSSSHIGNGKSFLATQSTMATIENQSGKDLSSTIHSIEPLQVELDFNNSETIIPVKDEELLVLHVSDLTLLDTTGGSTSLNPCSTSGQLTCSPRPCDDNSSSPRPLRFDEDFQSNEDENISVHDQRIDENTNQQILQQSPTKKLMKSNTQHQHQDESCNTLQEKKSFSTTSSTDEKNSYHSFINSHQSYEQSFPTNKSNSSTTITYTTFLLFISIFFNQVDL